MRLELRRLVPLLVRHDEREKLENISKPHELLVPVSSTHRFALRFHFRPIDVVVYDGS